MIRGSEILLVRSFASFVDQMAKAFGLSCGLLSGQKGCVLKKPQDAPRVSRGSRPNGWCSSDGGALDRAVDRLAWPKVSAICSDPLAKRNRALSAASTSPLLGGGGSCRSRRSRRSSVTMRLPASLGELGRDREMRQFNRRCDGHLDCWRHGGRRRSL